MKYYKVKKEYDQTRKPGNTHDIYVENELYTEKEVEKQNLRKGYMIEVNIPKNKTYVCFGARFAAIEESQE